MVLAKQDLPLYKPLDLMQWASVRISGAGLEAIADGG